MRAAIKSITSIAAGAFLAVALSGTAASGAQQTWTIDPGGPVDGFGENVFAALVNPETGEIRSSVTCEESTASGEAESGTSLPSERLARVDTIEFKTPGNPQDEACDGPSGLVVSIDPGGAPWYMNADEDGWDEETQTLTGTLTSDHELGVHADITVSDGCELKIRGKDGAPGQLVGKYDNVNGILSAQGEGSSNLIVADWNGSFPEGPCDDDLVNLGDEVIINADYFVDPFQTITPDN